MSKAPQWKRPTGDRVKRGHPESEMQISCVKWFRLQYPAHTLFSVPNGGKRAGRVGILIAEGLLPGVADLFLMAPSGKYHGLFIEMKVPGNYLSPAQKSFREKAIQQGYYHTVCYSFEEFRTIIVKYLNQQQYE